MDFHAKIENISSRRSLEIVFTRMGWTNKRTHGQTTQKHRPEHILSAETKTTSGQHLSAFLHKSGGKCKFTWITDIVIKCDCTPTVPAVAVGIIFSGCRSDIVNVTSQERLGEFHQIGLKDELIIMLVTGHCNLTKLKSSHAKYDNISQSIG